MKNLIPLSYFIISTFLALIVACANNEYQPDEDNIDDWVEVPASIINEALTIKLNELFFVDITGTQNEKFLNIIYPEIESKIIIVNSYEELLTVGISATLSEIDFSKYSLICGIIVTSSISNSIEKINLYSNDFQKNYNSELVINIPINNLPAQGYIPYWGIYPKLNAAYSISFKTIDNL